LPFAVNFFDVELKVCLVFVLPVLIDLFKLGVFVMSIIIELRPDFEDEMVEIPDY